MSSQGRTTNVKTTKLLSHAVLGGGVYELSLESLAPLPPWALFGEAKNALS